MRSPGVAGGGQSGAGAGGLEVELCGLAGTDPPVVGDVRELDGAAHPRVRFAFQAPVTPAPDGRLRPTGQALIPAGPAVTRTVATNPPVHASWSPLAGPA